VLVAVVAMLVAVCAFSLVGGVDESSCSLWSSASHSWSSGGVDAGVLLGGVVDEIVAGSDEGGVVVAAWVVVVLGTIVVVVVEGAVVVDAGEVVEVVVEVVVDDVVVDVVDVGVWAGMSGDDGLDDALMTLAAAAVTPPTTRALASATAASLRAGTRIRVGPLSPAGLLHTSLAGRRLLHRSLPTPEEGGVSRRQRVGLRDNPDLIAQDPEDCELVRVVAASTLGSVCGPFRDCRSFTHASSIPSRSSPMPPIGRLAGQSDGGRGCDVASESVGLELLAAGLVVGLGGPVRWTRSTMATRAATTMVAAIAARRSAMRRRVARGDFGLLVIGA
jgi:hypothetical protein